MDGRKYDDGKMAYHLVDVAALAWLVASLSYGQVKYAAENWRKVSDARERYYAALVRHLELWRGGEEFDPDTGGHLHHLAGVLVNAMFLCALFAPRDIREITKATAEAIKDWQWKQGAKSSELSGTIHPPGTK